MCVRLSVNVGVCVRLSSACECVRLSSACVLVRVSEST